jgi:hypothetical protein
MQTSQHGLRQHTPIVRYFVAVWSSRRSRCGWRWNSRPQTAMWTAVIVVRDPINERAFQVTLGKRDEVIQAFSAGVRTSRSQ